MKEKGIVKRAAAVVIMIALLMTGYAATASAASATQAQKDFIARVGEMARTDMQKSGILASLTIAQAILESGWGTSDLAVYANALFGIKADSRWSGKTYSKITQEVTGPVWAAFRAYGSWAESLADHSLFLRTGTRYAAVIGEKNYRTACRAIHQAGYATASDYADKLIKLIETYGLTAYDGGGAPQSEAVQPASIPAPAQSTPAPSNIPAQSGAPAPSGIPALKIVTPTKLTAEQRQLLVIILKEMCKR